MQYEQFSNCRGPMFAIWKVFFLFLFLLKKTNKQTNNVRDSQHNIVLTLVLPTTTLENFSLWPPNQKESNLSHLGDLSYILRGHFNEKKWGCKRG